MHTGPAPIRTSARLQVATCVLALAFGGAASGADAFEHDTGAGVDIRSKHTFPPTYPAEAIRDGLSGTTFVHVDVDAVGQVVDVSVGDSSGHAILDAAAVEAARHWTYAPALRDGQPAPGVVRIPVKFGD